MTPVFEFAQKKGWTSPEYWKAIHSREPLTEPYVRQNNIKPICSSQNLEIFLTEHMDKYGRRRGPGPVSRSIVEQSLKAWQYYRLRESSRNLYGLQTITWRHDNLEFVNKSSDVLRNQTVLNLIEGFSKREHRDRQLRCVDTCTGKRHLTGHEQMLEARWSFEKGTDESIRTHNVITLARSVAYRVSAIQGLKFRHMDSETTGSVAAGVPEIPAALLRAEDGKGNHVGRQLVTGCLPHSNPLLCSVAATGQTLVLQFHPHLWNRIPPDFSSRDKWFGMHVLTAFENRNCHNMISQTTLCNDIGRMFTEAFGWSEDRVKRDLKGICSHLGRCTNAADTSDANAPDRQADRIGGWSSSEGSRRDSSYLVHRIPLAAARALAGTHREMTWLDLTGWIACRTQRLQFSLVYMSQTWQGRYCRQLLCDSSASGPHFREATGRG